MRLAFNRRARSGFSLFEIIVTIFIFLVGVMGAIATFSAGIRARIIAQELIVSHDLAQTWAEWIRFRLNESPSGGAPAGTTIRTALNVGDSGDFYANTGSHYLAPPDGTANPPTYHRSAYKGYRWTVTQADHTFKPQWEDASGKLHDWTQRLDGGSVYPAMLGGPPGDLTRIELTVSRGARQYRFNLIFSGVGFKYDSL